MPAMRRADAPLVAADDAHFIDTSHMTPQAVLDQALDLALPFLPKSN